MYRPSQDFGSAGRGGVESYGLRAAIMGKPPDRPYGAVLLRGVSLPQPSPVDYDVSAAHSLRAGWESQCFTAFAPGHRFRTPGALSIHGSPKIAWLPTRRQTMCGSPGRTSAP
jgi:hypothetical protein